MEACFSTAYLPTSAWFAEALKYSSILIESKESWQKQSYRNRTYILGPNGPLMLNIPVDHKTTKQRIDQVRISYAENWQHRHWQAILSAYGSAPFFESLAADLEPFFRSKTSFLLDFNTKLIELIFNWLQINTAINFTDNWASERDLDFREDFHPKRTSEDQIPYPQIFSDRTNFVPHLSVIDLLFNEGRASYDYLVG